MNTENQSDSLGRRVDAALTRLPEWQAPPGFAARLAAAAARAAPAARVQPEPFWVEALHSFSSLVPTVLGCAAVAAALTWAVPWAQVAAGTGLVWACVAAMGSAGLVLTLRVLRAP